jgi:hypothetical protein
VGFSVCAPRGYDRHAPALRALASRPVLTVVRLHGPCSPTWCRRRAKRRHVVASLSGAGVVSSMRRFVVSRPTWRPAARA